MTFVIVSGGIDLSVGSIIALVCVITANMVNDPVSYTHLDVYKRQPQD